MQNNNLELNLQRGLLAGAELICQQILSLINKYKTGQNCLKKHFRAPEINQKQMKFERYLFMNNWRHFGQR